MQKIIPHLWFDKEAIEATKFYCSIFPNSKIVKTSTIKNTPSGDCDIVNFELNNQPFMAISAGPVFTFNEAISFIIPCKDQDEIDFFWDKLSAVKEAELCGWIKDKYGVSWQIVPENMDELMSKNPKKTTPAMLKMKKIIIKDLEKAGKDK